MFQEIATIILTMQSCIKFSVFALFCLATIANFLHFTEAKDQMNWDDIAKLFAENQKRNFYKIDDGFENKQNGDMKTDDAFDKFSIHELLLRSVEKDQQRKGELRFYGKSDFDLMNIQERKPRYILSIFNIDEKRTSMHDKDNSLYVEKVDIIKAMQTSHGPKEEPSSGDSMEEPPSELEREIPIPSPDYNDVPDICKNSSIDAAVTQDGKAYLFKGDYYWQIDNEGIVDGYPRRIIEDWNGLEGNLDAAFSWSNGRTYFFKGKQYWRFRNKLMDPGYPKLISRGFKGIPDDIDAAVIWSNDSKTYFYKGDKYWRYNSLNDPPVNSKYPQPLSDWYGLPRDIDAAIQWENSVTYFFKKNQYYRFNDHRVEVEDDYPQPTAFAWFKLRC